MKYKAIIFDLDGTLVNSLEDIADSMNTVLQNNNYPTHSYEAYNYFVGSGLRNLTSQTIPEANRSEKEIDRCFIAMMEVYSTNCTLKTKPYSGIIELLDELKSRNIPLSVLSNKADELTKKITNELLPNYFDPILGLKEEEYKKPHPFVVTQMCKDLGFNPEEIIYMGDTGIDMQTAINANMAGVGVTWGFRTKEELVANGAKHLLNHPSDLLELI